MMRAPVLYRALLALSALAMLALPVQAEEPIVHAVLFTSPTCPYCHQARTQVIIPLSEKHGRALQIASLDVTRPGGRSLFQKAIEAFSVPQNRRGVPMLIIGDTVLVGSGEIAEQFPGLVERGLARGGVAWPAIPGLTEALGEMTPTPTALPRMESPQPTVEGLPRERPRRSVAPGRASDRVGNSLALLMLIGMAVSFIGVIGQGILTLWRGDGRRSAAEPKGFQAWAVPLLCALGLAVAGYLSYADIAGVEAVCGPIGECNALQQSEYSSLFGVLPVSILGLIGYLMILAAWAIGRYAREAFAQLAKEAQLGLTLFGTAFSIYLMILGSFVVEATCLWCLASALAMTLLMLLSARPGWQALAR